MEYSQQTQKVINAYHFTPADVILCYAIAAGAHTTDAYNIIFKPDQKLTTEHVTTLFNNWQREHPAAAVLINRLKQRRSPKPTKEEMRTAEEEIIKDDEETRGKREELKTRAGIIDALINNVAKVSGKDAVSGLQTLAKLQGLDKPEEKEGDDKRVFYLPYVSNCRNCALMSYYQDAVSGTADK